MVSIITAWLVKLATRILRDRLASLNGDVEQLQLRLESRTLSLEHQEEENGKLLAAVNAAADATGAMKDALEKLRTDNGVLRRQLDNQAATIREYQMEKENLLCTIDILQANVSDWSRLFATIERQIGTSRETAIRLRREIDAFTVQGSSAAKAGSSE